MRSAQNFLRTFSSCGSRASLVAAGLVSLMALTGLSAGCNDMAATAFGPGGTGLSGLFDGGFGTFNTGFGDPTNIGVSPAAVSDALFTTTVAGFQPTFGVPGVTNVTPGLTTGGTLATGGLGTLGEGGVISTGVTGLPSSTLGIEMTPSLANAFGFGTVNVGTTTTGVGTLGTTSGVLNGLGSPALFNTGTFGGPISSPFGTSVISGLGSTSGIFGSPTLRSVGAQ
ncbi:MAG TPA: hypothetical protein PLT93_11740 [Phycisphaerae bacterium]|nr:hypothetical protein [Phycisphaerae bacterium]HPZ98802.1 hypothetical protein [Phycisphaerae bacterium]